MDRFATPSECRQHAVHCRTRADTATGERVRALWISMARMWTKLATHCERLQRLNAQGAYSDTPTETQVESCPSVRPLQSAHESAHPHPRPQERRRILPLRETRRRGHAFRATRVVRSKRAC